MSISVKIRTAEQLRPASLMNELVERGENIVVVEPDYPEVLFGKLDESLRGVKLSQVDGGYQLSVDSFSSREDYRLFARSVDIVRTITSGKAFIDDDSEQIVEDAQSLFTEEWIEEKLDASLMVNVALTRTYGQMNIYQGLFIPFCVGARLLYGFDIPLYGEYRTSDRDALLRHLIMLQWYFSDKSDTYSEIELPSPDEGGQGMGISMVSMRGGRVTEFEYVSYRELFGFNNMDGDDIAIMPFKYVPRVLPQRKFKIMDECQMAKAGLLNAEDAADIMGRVKAYMPEDVFHYESYPGSGVDTAVRTFLLEGDSQYPQSVLKSVICEMRHGRFVWSEPKAQMRMGDRFYLTLNGEIVMAGVFSSNPFEGSIDLAPSMVLDPSAISGIRADYAFGLLSDADAAEIESRFAAFLDEVEDRADGITLDLIKSL